MVFSQPEPGVAQALYLLREVYGSCDGAGGGFTGVHRD